MKKLLIGCLVIIALGVVVFVAGGYWLYRAASPMVQNAREAWARMSEFNEIDKDIKNTTPYASPASGELTEAQMQRFARVQDVVRKALGQRFNEIEAKYKHLNDNTDRGAQVSFTEAVSALGDMAGLFVQARRYQVDAMNAEGFAQTEYTWVRNQVFQAAGMEVTSMVDVKKIQEALRTGTGIDNIEAPRVPSLNVPEKNRALVKPYLKRMDEWIPLAFFGM